MRLNAKMTTERQSRIVQKSSNTRILIDLHWKNKKIGTIGLYDIIDDKVEGYNLVFSTGHGWADAEIIDRLEQDKKEN